MLTKICTKCGVEKTVNNFSKHKTGKFGVRSSCKSCLNREDYQRRENKRTKYPDEYKRIRSEICSRYRLRNKEKINDYDRKYKELNADRLRDQAITRYYRNPKAHKDRSKAHVNSLAVCYVSHRLRSSGIPITPETIEMKRLQIKIIRRIKNETH